MSTKDKPQKGSPQAQRRGLLQQRNVLAGQQAAGPSRVAPGELVELLDGVTVDSRQLVHLLFRLPELRTS